MGRKPRRKPADLKLAVAALRVSTDRQNQALGAEAQRASIDAWARREGVRIVSWHLDECSGGSPLAKRPGLVAALADLAVHGAGVLVFHRVDRFTRDATAAALVGLELQKHGARLAFADGHGEGDDPTGKLVRSILVAVSEFERALIAARIKAALAVKKGRGEMTGKAPYGFRSKPGPTRVGRDGQARRVAVLEPDPAEQRVLKAAHALRTKGLSLRAIVAALTKRGMTNRAGHAFTLPALNKMLRPPQEKP